MLYSIDYRIVQKITIRKSLQEFFLNNILTNKQRQKIFKFNLNLSKIGLRILKT